MQPPMSSLLRSFDNGPPSGSDWVAKRDRLTRIGFGYGTQGTGQPCEQVAKGQSLQFQWLSDRQCLQSGHVGAFDTDCVEHEFLLFLAIADRLGCVGPCVSGGAIGNEEDPGPVIRNAMSLVDVLARSQQLEAVHYRLAHRGVSAGLKLKGGKLRGGGIVTIYLDRAKGDDGYFNALGGERVCHQLFGEGSKPGVELVDGVTAHRAGRIQQQQTGAARFRIVREFSAAKGDLLKRLWHWGSLGSPCQPAYNFTVRLSARNDLELGSRHCTELIRMVFSRAPSKVR